jgi:hypothetical protein
LPESSESADQLSLFARTSPAICPAGTPESSPIWRRWVTDLRQWSRQRGLSERPTSGRGSSGSLPTPTTEDAARTGSAEAWNEWKRNGRETQCRLRNAIHVLPTPRTGCHGEPGQGPRHPTILSALPTPTATDSKESRNATSGRQEGSRHHSGTTLTDVVWSLPTPQAHDGRRPDPSPGQGTRERGGRQADLTVAVGGRLSPRFVEQMMLIPVGWTACEPLGTELSLPRPRSPLTFSPGNCSGEEE